ncbi:hypothetical protein DEO72_LG4g864 [Vigna unguiculata]|uniref:Uncharacterized protein n=1 Tax=Vigna unguiculata TaxID=3917 RepID=A0A4D6LM86_VIGUN|nr:hypothetical protein DEO72_LG4g864 [Vigna unguiculata]
MMKKICMKKTNDQVSILTQNRSGQPSSTMCTPVPHPSCPRPSNPPQLSFPPQSSITPQFASQLAGHMNSHPIENNNEPPPPPPHMSSMLSTSRSNISIEDSLAHVLGSKEHCGRVRGMGLGPCPSRVFGYTRNFHFGTSSSCPSYSELQNQVTALKSQLDEQNKRNEERDKRLDAIMNFFSQNYQGQLPPELTMFNPAPVSDQGSVPTNTTSSGHEENHM